MSSRFYQESFASMVRWSPWTWFALLFAGQVLGSLVVAVASGMNLQELIFPILLLLVGALHAAAVRMRTAGTPERWHDWVPAAIYAGFIFAMSNRSLSDAHLPVNANVFHPFEYAVLAIFFCWTGRGMLLSGRAGALFGRVIVSGLAFALLDEFHQSFIPGRTATKIDVVLDGIGLCLGCGVFVGSGRLHRIFSPARAAAARFSNGVHDER